MTEHADTASLRRPDASEFGPLPARYVRLVHETDIVTALEVQAAQVERWPARVAPDREVQPYEPGKWTPRDVVGHLGDAERIFSYRALRFSRGDLTSLPGFDEAPYVEAASYAEVPLDQLVAEFVALRRANLPLFRRLDDVAWSRVGEASGVPISVRALAYVMVGHVRHHAAVLRERYGLLVD